jgi:hypothetical protein
MTNSFTQLPWDIIDLLALKWLPPKSRNNLVCAYPVLWRRRQQLYKMLYQQELPQIDLLDEQNYYVGYIKAQQLQSCDDFIIKFIIQSGYERSYRKYVEDAKGCNIEDHLLLAVEFDRSDMVHLILKMTELIYPEDFVCSMVQYGRIELIKQFPGLIRRNYHYALSRSISQDKVLRYLLELDLSSIPNSTDNIRRGYISAVRCEKVSAIYILIAWDQKQTTPILDHEEALGDIIRFKRYDLIDVIMPYCKHFRYAINHAISYDNFDSVKRFMAARTEPSSIKGHLEIASQLSRIEILEYLCTSSPKPIEWGGSLILAVRHSSLEAVKILVSHGAKVHRNNYREAQTRQNQQEMVAYLASFLPHYQL